MTASKPDVLVVGGGIIGTALAWALADRAGASVTVVDLDLSGVYASSELNAGGARATWWQPVNIETCRLTLDFFRAHAAEFGFRERGYLWLYTDRDLFDRAREKRRLQNRMGLDVEILDPGEVRARFPVVDRGLDGLRGATFSPRDGLVNPNAVRAWYRREAEARGVHFLDRSYAAGVRTALVAGAGPARRRVAEVELVHVRARRGPDEEGVLRNMLTHHSLPESLVEGREWRPSEVVVNCLGAWSAIFSAKVGVPDVTQPVRRQIAMVDVHRRDLAPGVDLRELGMIVDASGLYFHPEGPFVLAGYSIPDEPPGFDFHYDGDAFFEGEIWPRLAARCSSFERCGHLRGWAGLYAVTPDRSGIAGAVGGFSNLFEAHSFTGRGVMQSWGVARGLAARIAGADGGEVDLAPLSRDRFGDPPRLLPEDLHI